MDLDMDYFGKGTFEQQILDFLDMQKERKNLSTQDLIGSVNKVVEYYREGLMYDFDESEFPSTLELQKMEGMEETKE